MKKFVFKVLFNFWNKVWWWIVAFAGEDFTEWLEEENNLLLTKMEKQELTHT